MKLNALAQKNMKLVTEFKSLNNSKNYLRTNKHRHNTFKCFSCFKLYSSLINKFSRNTNTKYSATGRLGQARPGRLYSLKLKAKGKPIILVPSFMPTVFSSIQHGIYPLRKAFINSTPSPKIFPSVAFETVPVLV